jgi:hypothetical protein
MAVSHNGFISPKETARRQYMAALIDAVVLIQATTVHVLYRHFIGRPRVHVYQQLGKRISADTSSVIANNNSARLSSEGHKNLPAVDSVFTRLKL